MDSAANVDESLVGLARRALMYVTSVPRRCAARLLVMVLRKFWSELIDAASWLEVEYSPGRRNTVLDIIQRSWFIVVTAEAQDVVIT